MKLNSAFATASNLDGLASSSELGSIYRNINIKQHSAMADIQETLSAWQSSMAELNVWNHYIIRIISGFFVSLPSHATRAPIPICFPRRTTMSSAPLADEQHPHRSPWHCSWPYRSPASSSSTSFFGHGDSCSGRPHPLQIVAKDENH